MNVTEPFVLQNDVVLVPCADLSDDVRSRIDFDEGDFALSRRHGRTLTQVIDGTTAALLALFRRPCTIADAVIENGLAAGKDPEAWLDELLPFLGSFIQAKVLVPVGSEEEKEIRPQYEAGARIGGWEVVRCVSLIEDSEVYQLRSGDGVAALKVSRTAMAMEGSLFGNEADILRHLDGSGVAPRLLDCGLDDGRPYLVIDWIAGVEVTVAAAKRRHDRAALIAMCAAIASAYAALHARGVLHSDVHPRNVFVDDSGNVTLLDFGFARLAEEPPRIGRGGMGYFWEPEYLAGLRDCITVPSSAAGEQYALAAMLYLLLCGDHYLDFRYDREEMWRQIESEPPLPFAARGIPPWPDVQQILFRALQKDPAARHASVAEMAALLAEARDTAVRNALATPLSAQALELLETTLQSFARGGAMFASGYPTAPKASINYGCAGAAVGLLQIAERRSDPALLALAEVWRSRAFALIDSDEAYYNADDEMPPSLLGEVTPYHTESGLHAAAAMIAAARGDAVSQSHAIDAFIRASSKPCAQLDLTLGRSGTLLAAAMLLPLGESEELRAFGAETMRAIWEELDARPPLEASPPDTFLGMAHGWAGYFYAALRWCEASGDALPSRLVERLEQYAALATRTARGVFWRMRMDAPPVETISGWCHGSAGQLFLFTLAHRLLGDARWLNLAELCAWDCWEQPCGSAILCCGSAGRAYALLNFYRHTGDAAWLGRARQLANHAAGAAAATTARANTLSKGELGVAVLIADLASPENARMPFFE